MRGRPNGAAGHCPVVLCHPAISSRICHHVCLVHNPSIRSDRPGGPGSNCALVDSSSNVVTDAVLADPSHFRGPNASYSVCFAMHKLDDLSRTAGRAVEGTVFLDRSLRGVGVPDEPGLARGPRPGHNG